MGHQHRVQTGGADRGEGLQDGGHDPPVLVLEEQGEPEGGRVGVGEGERAGEIGADLPPGVGRQARQEQQERIGVEPRESGQGRPPHRRRAVREQLDRDLGRFRRADRAEGVEEGDQQARVEVAAAQQVAQRRGRRRVAEGGPAPGPRQHDPRFPPVPVEELERGRGPPTRRRAPPVRGRPSRPRTVPPARARRGGDRPPGGRRPAPARRRPATTREGDRRTRRGPPRRARRSRPARPGRRPPTGTLRPGGPTDIPSRRDRRRRPP